MRAVFVKITKEAGEPSRSARHAFDLSAILFRSDGIRRLSGTDGSRLGLERAGTKADGKPICNVHPFPLAGIRSIDEWGCKLIGSANVKRDEDSERCLNY
ncbi:hypothetical protein D9M70_646370 [compost metagenome]